MKSFPFPDRASSIEELKRDLVYTRIPSEQRIAICDRAWAVGVEKAIDIVRKYPGKPIFDIIDLAGLTCIRNQRDKVIMGLRYFSEYSPKEKKIVLYMGSVKKFAKRNHLSNQEAEELILAHEFFHHLEWTEIGRVSDSYTVPHLLFGRFRLGKSPVRTLSEIAAHGFARSYWENQHGLLPRDMNALEEGLF